MRRRGILIALVALLGGCASPGIWYKPDFEQQRFAQDRYACLQQTQVPVSNATINAYGGYAQSGIVTDEKMFSACMHTKGYLWRTRNS